MIHFITVCILLALGLVFTLNVSFSDSWSSNDKEANEFRQSVSPTVTCLIHLIIACDHYLPCLSYFPGVLLHLAYSCYFSCLPRLPSMSLSLVWDCCVLRLPGDYCFSHLPYFFACDIYFMCLFVLPVVAICLICLDISIFV